jgi:uncharacterized protein
MHSCLYHGYVQHRRLSPAKHVFRYGLYLAYVDLAELPTLLAGRYGVGRGRFAPASFFRADHLGDADRPLADAVADLVEQRSGRRPEGPVRLLTPLRNWGYYFSPLSLYYCFDRAGQKVDTVVAEVTNTPWLERHWYVLDARNQCGKPSQLRYRHPKDFHVSPFLDMDLQYEWFLREPGEQLKVAIVNSQGGQRVFDVSMVLRRRELSRRSVRRTLIRHPWMTGRMVQAIYWQAVWLWWKKCPFYAHPTTLPESEAP